MGSFIAKLISVRSLKIALVVQSFITTIAILYIMYTTHVYLNQNSKLEISFTDKQCQGCCSMPNSSIHSIVNEKRISEKLHKFSRAIRKYEIPVQVMNILHDAEHLIEKLEADVKQYKDSKENRLTALKNSLLEEDVLQDKDLIPKAKPKSKH
ncbi:uncharacterized protein LOC124446660 isoform X2 [Xenia sp. Carnegie-2017]|uniref:uncharacterized protein LOC124446660 isoform X2 n=1 Tax=Xenia sp. Carnegie-2017 TaxID=2897299 RepID=UPI001F035867|nr:uncharacterized protein LOC124446660 isoform X2 [Xenia sp. Carnegie-2017]